MKLRRWRSSVVVFTLLLGTGAWAQEQGREFHWSGKLSADQLLTIKNINGDIDASTGNSDQVELNAEKSGPNADQIRIAVVPGGEGVTICAIYPGSSSDCDSEHGYSTHVHGNNNGKVHFTVRMPKNVRFEADNVNGNVNAEGLGRAVRANSVNGNVNVSTTRWAEAQTVNGRIKAAMGEAGWTGTLKISSVNGSIELDMPSDFNAEVKFSSVNGRIDSDFPLTVSNNWPVGHNASGTIGKGGRELELQTVNGKVELKKGSAGI